MPYKDPEKRKEYERNRKRERKYNPEQRKEYYESHKDEFAAYKKKYYDEHREGLLKQKKDYNLEHKAQKAEYNRKYREKNRDKLIEQCKKYRLEHLEELREYDRLRRPAKPKKVLTSEEKAARAEAWKLYHKEYAEKWYSENKEAVLKQHREWKKANKAKLKADARALRQVIKKEVIEHYGGKCAACGESDLDKLCIDHINNDGAMHRKIVHSSRVYRWIQANNYPSDLQCLCANCNTKKERARRATKVKMDAESVWYRNMNKAQRIEVLKHYGGKCARCGCDDPDVLCFDHINGGGARHRKEIKQPVFHRWLMRNNYPEGFQVLCHNCNLKKYVSVESKK